MLKFQFLTKKLYVKFHFIGKFDASSSLKNSLTEAFFITLEYNLALRIRIILFVDLIPDVVVMF